MVKIRFQVDDELLKRFREIAAAKYKYSTNLLGKALTEAMKQRIAEVERMRALDDYPT